MADTLKLQKDLREFIKSLNANGVEYLLVGAFAVAYHAIPRATLDIDFFVRPSLENGERIRAALVDFGFGSLELRPGDFQKEDTIVQLGRHPYRIDLMTSVSGLTFEEAWNGRVDDQLDGIPVHFLGREGLIKNKRASDRLKDRVDLDLLEDS